MTRRAALLLVDLQQDYLARPGLCPPAGVLLDGLSAMLAACRGAGLKVFHSRTIVSRAVDNRMPHWKRADRWACVENTPGAAPPPALAPLPDEAVFAKPFFSAFGNTELDRALRQAGVDTLILAGLYSHACVRATALDAYQLGYTVWIAADGVASDAPLHADLSLRYLDERACRVLPFSDIARQIGLPLAAAPEAAVAETVPHLHVGGRWQPAEGHACRTQRNPADWNERLARVPLGAAADVDRALDALCARQPQWQRESGARRAALLSAWGDALARRQEAFARLLAREIGKPLAEGEAEVGYAVALVRAAVRRMEGEGDEPIAAGVRARHRALGVVGLVTPWNNPLAIPAGKIAPALACGNTVLWKPALPAPRTVALMVEALREAGLPEDCLDVVMGDAGTVQPMLADARVAAVSFTGSEAAGRQIAALCAARGKPLQAELGGNNAVLVAASADIGAVAAELAAAAYSFAGQRCTAPRRFIVAREVEAAFTGAFIARAGALRIGDPSVPGTELGPVLNRERQSLMASLVEESLRDGGRLLCGGRVPPGLEHGCWFQPTLLAGLGEQARAVREEAFGPVAVLQVADDFAHALRLCNGVAQGLVATLHSADPAEQDRFLAEAEAGILRVNHGQAGIHADAPFAGWKSSGMGLPEHGRWDREFYTRPQAVYRGG